MRHNITAVQSLFSAAVVFCGGLGLVVSFYDRGFLRFGIWKPHVCLIIMLVWFAGLMAGLFYGLEGRVQKGPISCQWSAQWSLPTAAILTISLLFAPQWLGPWLLLPAFFFNLFCLGLWVAVRFDDSNYLDEMDKLRAQHLIAP